MQQIVWKTLHATGVTNAARSATESLVSMAARQLTEAATAELERRLTSGSTGSGAGGRGRKRPAGSPRPGGRAVTGYPAVSLPRRGAADRDQDSLRQLRIAIAALDATIDGLATR